MKSNTFLTITCLVLVHDLLARRVGSAAATLPYNAIFNFGDSLSDTGNFLISGALAFPVIGKLPYGETFFRHPTGRCSDGRLAIDFIAAAYGLPYLPPYLKLSNGQNISQGVNFAVGGATALDAELLREKKIGAALWTNDSLSVQIGWFKKIKPSICTNRRDCVSYFKRSLFMVGEIGGNDYNYAYFLGGDINKVRPLVPSVVGAIMNATRVLINEGAVELLVPGNFPIGCSPLYLTLFRSMNKYDYDRNGCLKAFNAFARYHNEQLKVALEKLRQEYSQQVKISYADYYGVSKPFYHKPKHHGFSKTEVLKACCGGGGPYNFNYTARCGHVGSNACTHPSSYASWDGIHPTEAAYKYIAKGILSGSFSIPPLRPPPFDMI